MGRFSCEDCGTSYGAKCMDCGYALMEKSTSEERLLWCRNCNAARKPSLHCGKAMKFTG